ncbi:hypothetical protein RGQ29_003083 [Quercus rubra]|uniref:Uncharacterized protein n=1 Tax=Quercus rubra TaxID=3512 RepID=A0AAN7EAY7_QUERU|nr:hypothetical protein RGQ29_003083 [Quercus rubra]
MYCSSSSSIFTAPSPSPSPRSSNLSFFPFPQFALQIPSLQTLRLSLTLCNAAPKPPTGPNSKTKTKTKTKTKKKKKSNNKGLDFSNVEVVNDDDDDDDNGEGLSDAPLPKPPAGFVVDDHGRLVMASPPSKRITTIVDPMNNLPLECVIRECSEVLKGMNACCFAQLTHIEEHKHDGWSAVNDEEVEVILPSAAYALSKINMHLVHSGFCYTARGGFCYSEDDIFDFRTDDGQDVDGLPTEGVEITFFHLDGSQYMIYTPSDPLLFVVVKNHTGVLQIADDDLLEDPSIISAIDEETEFNALVEEEAALLESLKFGES